MWDARINLYFWVGLASAILLRSIIIAEEYNLAGHYNAFWGKIWYLGITGHLWFFTHRYNISKRRFGVIKDLNLLEKIRARQKFSEKDLEGPEYLL